jgi:hypothetical protein
MNPNVEFGQAVRGRNTGRRTGITDTRPLICVVEGLTFLEQSPAWDRKGQRRHAEVVPVLSRMTDDERKRRRG